jgi:hypothetical protein
MNLKFNMRHSILLKALCVSLILFLGVGFSFAGAQANSCEGGAGCLICARQAHHYLPGVQTRVEKPGCSPSEQNNACGFKAGQDSEKFFGIASTIRSFYPVRTGILGGASDEFDPFRIPRGLSTPSFLAEPGPKAPIYLRIHSLLC